MSSLLDEPSKTKSTLPKPEGKKSPWLWVILGIVLLAIIVTIIIVVLRPKKSSSAPSTNNQPSTNQPSGTTPSGTSPSGTTPSSTPSSTPSGPTVPYSDPTKIGQCKTLANAVTDLSKLPASTSLVLENLAFPGLFVNYCPGCLGTTQPVTAIIESNATKDTALANTTYQWLIPPGGIGGKVNIQNVYGQAHGEPSYLSLCQGCNTKSAVASNIQACFGSGTLDASFNITDKTATVANYTPIFNSDGSYTFTGSNGQFLISRSECGNYLFVNGDPNSPTDLHTHWCVYPVPAV